MRTDTCPQQTNTCQTPDARLHVIPHNGSGPDDKTGKSPGRFCTRLSGHQVYFAGIKKGRPVGLPLRTSSVLDAFDVGSPHAVFWTVCSSGVCQHRWVPRPQPACLGGLHWTVCPSSDLGDKNRPGPPTDDCEDCLNKHHLRNFYPRIDNLTQLSR
ncbi:hypothetical protein BN844_5162 [Pseudomonas sp. SHC52]|nr:hypothetical protein BN844_5162 [Pseudomonas sp. SHC52]